MHSMLINAPEEMRIGIEQRVSGCIAGAAPPASVIEGMERIGFDITHVYGLTETYGPAAVCAKQASWNELPWTNAPHSTAARVYARRCSKT